MAVLAFVHTMSNLESDGGYKGCFLCVNCDFGENSHGRQPYWMGNAIIAISTLIVCFCIV